MALPQLQGGELGEELVVEAHVALVLVGFVEGTAVLASLYFLVPGHIK